MANRDSLLAHCIARAVIQDEGGLEAAKAKYGEHAERWSTWSKLRAVTTWVGDGAPADVSVTFSVPLAVALNGWKSAPPMSTVPVKFSASTGVGIVMPPPVLLPLVQPATAMAAAMAGTRRTYPFIVTLSSLAACDLRIVAAGASAEL